MAAEARKKPPEDNAGPKIVGEGLVIDEWVNPRAIIDQFSQSLLHSHTHQLGQSVDLAAELIFPIAEGAERKIPRSAAG